MADTDPHSAILRTKLYRPPVTADFTPRKALNAILEAGIELPLTLVCAPAGYGKSTSISRWLETNSRPGAWLSLDDSDSDLRNFLCYVVAAVQTLDADSCQQTMEDLNAPCLPETSVIIVHLSNDLEALKERIVLVLDDFQRISDPSVHNILDSLLEHPPHNLHLVILSRRDPILSLANLRARHQLNEIRLRDLKFSSAETGTFIRTATNRSIAAEIIEALQNKTEGWPAGLRLAMLALHNKENVDLFLSRFGADTRPMQEYLIGEVLSSLSPDMREKLVYTAILERFNASLCESVWDNDLSVEPDAHRGRRFIDSLQSDEIFCIALDEGNEWYRFHHLFQGLLGHKLLDSVGKERVAELHLRASRWFFKHNYFEEAIRHALTGEDPGLAIEIIGQARHQLMDSDQWHRLDTWLKPFSIQTIEQQAQLLLSQCWLDFCLTYRLGQMTQHVERVAIVLQHSTPDTPKLDELKAELNCLQAILAYSVCDAARSVTLSRQCLRDSPLEQQCVRSCACWVQIMTDQMRGELNQAESLMWDTLGSGELRTASGRARLWIGTAYSAWCEGDTGKLRETAEQLGKIGAEHQLSATISYAHYFRGLTHYDSNELDEAITQFEFVADNPQQFASARVVDCTILLSLCHQTLGNEQRARDYLEQVSAYIFEHSAALFLGLTQALRAEIDYRQGRIAHAIQWASTYALPPTHSMQRCYQSEFVAAKILLAQNTPESRAAAGKILDYLHDLLTKIHHRRYLFEVLALQSSRAYREADEATAISLLGQAFELGKPGRLVRPFVDLGPEMIPLLNRLDLDREGLEYLGIILSTLPGADDETPSPNSSMPEVLSQRELEILELLARDHSNKAIAEKLFISMGTVKRHAHNIFSKLGVKGRRSAVAKAIGLGILKK